MAWQTGTRGSLSTTPVGRSVTLFPCWRTIVPPPFGMLPQQRSVLGEDMVQLLSGLHQDGGGPLDLLLPSGVDRLLGGHAELEHRGPQVSDTR